MFLCFNSLFCCPHLQLESKYFCSWFTKYKLSIARARHKRTNNLSQLPFSVPMPQRQPWQLLLIVLQLIAAPVNEDLIGKVQRCAQKTNRIFKDGISSDCFWVHFLRMNQRQSTVIINQLSFFLFSIFVSLAVSSNINVFQICGSRKMEVAALNQMKRSRNDFNLIKIPTGLSRHGMRWANSHELDVL